MYGWLRYTPEEGLVVSLPAYGAPADLGIDPKLIPGRKAHPMSGNGYPSHWEKSSPR